MTQSDSPVARALRTLNQSTETHTTTGSTEQVDTDRIKAAVREGVAEALADAEVARRPAESESEVEAEAETETESQSDPDARGRPSGGRLLVGVVLLAAAAFFARRRNQADDEDAVPASDFDTQSTDGGVDAADD
jgi:hypothetical protein